NEGMCMLMSIMQFLPNLQSLKLSDKPMTKHEKAPEAFYSSMSQNKSLQTLKLIRCGLGGTTKEARSIVWEMARRPPTLPALTKLVLSENGFDDTHVPMIFELCKHYPNLESVDLGRNYFSSRGAAALDRLKGAVRHRVRGSKE
ncbi:hypothetical protein KIPB_011541, partial [Kipferlia bialata]